MQLVKTRREVIKNIYRLYTYLHLGSVNEIDFAKSLLAKGGVYSVLRIGDSYLFAPSKFVGYVNNSINDHKSDDSFHGGKANGALSKVYGEERNNDSLLAEFKKFLLKHTIHRNFDTEKEIRFFFDDLNVEGSNACYFLSPTHIRGKKPFAWNNLLTKGIAAVGWGHNDYTGWDWQDKRI